MKLILTLICAAVALPSIAQAFYFGITLTDAATGATIQALDAFQTGTVLSVGILGAAFIFALGSLTSGYPGSYGGGGYGSQVILGHGRRRRAAMQEEEQLDLDEVFNVLFEDIFKSQTEGCFQRLVCDMAAKPEDYKQNSPILMAVEMMEDHGLNSTVATTVSQLLLDAAKLGQDAKDGSMCEAIFNHCHWSGPQMDRIITIFDSKVTLQP